MRSPTAVVRQITVKRSACELPPDLKDDAGVRTVNDQALAALGESTTLGRPLHAG